MIKWKTALVLLLTIGVLVCAACLPWTVSAVMDWSRVGKTDYGAIQPLELQFREEEVTLGPDYSLRRLRLQANMSTAPISETEATMTQEEVYGAVERGMQEYMDAGIFNWFDMNAASAQAYLGFDPEDTGNYMIFWGVSMVQEEDPYHSLFVHIDDATGAITRIVYERYGKYKEDAALTESPYIMEALTTIYFEQLGITQSYLENAGAAVDMGEVDGGVLYARYTIPTEEYGQLFVEFYVTGPGGFSIHFPLNDAA